MYLAPEALEGTLAVIRDRSALGSTLLVTYATEALTSMVEGPLAALAPIVHFGFGLLGEPLRGSMSAESARARLGAVGFEVESDTGPAEWARDHFRGRPSGIRIGERLVRAVRR